MRALLLAGVAALSIASTAHAGDAVPFHKFPGYVGGYAFYLTCKAKGMRTMYVTVVPDNEPPSVDWSFSPAGSKILDSKNALITNHFDLDDEHPSFAWNNHGAQYDLVHVEGLRWRLTGTHVEEEWTRTCIRYSEPAPPLEVGGRPR